MNTPQREPTAKLTIEQAKEQANEQTTAPRPQAALRLVKTTHLDREAWLDLRKTGIGSSDAAAAVGLNPYQSQLALWMNKTGRDELLPKDDPNDERSPMYWGTLLENIVAAHYTKRTGRRVRRINAVLQHPQHAWMLANIDREVMGCAQVQLLECKTAGMHGAKLWRDGVPEYVQLQVMHQLAVTGKQSADVAVLLCGQELQIHRIERDDALIDRLIALEQAFWELVQSETPPLADGSDSADQALRGLYPQDSGATLYLTQEPGMASAFNDLLAVRQSLSTQTELEARLKQKIQQRMGSATTAVFAAGRVTFKRSMDVTLLDADKLLQEQPELMQRYAKVRPGFRRFVVNT